MIVEFGRHSSEFTMNDDQFLIFLQNNITNHPERLQTVDANLVTRINSLVGDCVDIDIDDPLPDDDAEESL